MRHHRAQYDVIVMCLDFWYFRRSLQMIYHYFLRPQCNVMYCLSRLSNFHYKHETVVRPYKRTVIILYARALINFASVPVYQIARFMGPTWGPPGSCRPRMGPCWPHEPCYQGIVTVVIHSMGIDSFVRQNTFLLPYSNRVNCSDTQTRKRHYFCLTSTIKQVHFTKSS